MAHNGLTTIEKAPSSPPPYTSVLDPKPCPATEAPDILKVQSQRWEELTQSKITATLSMTTAKNQTEFEFSCLRVRRALSLNTRAFSVCPHLVPSERGFFSRICPPKHWIFSSNEGLRKFFARRSDTSKTVECETCKAACWLMQDCNSGVLTLWVRRSWDGDLERRGAVWLVPSAGWFGYPNGKASLRVDDEVYDARQINGTWEWVRT